MFNNALAAGVMNNCRVPNSTPHMNSFLYMLSRMGRHACLPVFHLDLHIPPWSKIACHVQCCLHAIFFLQESLKYFCFNLNFVLEMYSSATRVLLVTRTRLVREVSTRTRTRTRQNAEVSTRTRTRTRGIQISSTRYSLLVLEFRVAKPDVDPCVRTHKPLLTYGP